MRELKKDLWPYRVALALKDTDSSITDIEIWLGQQLGSFKGLWNVVYHHNQTVFYFRDQATATLFALKWS